MAKDFSFDVVSRIEMAEVVNAVNQAEKELAQRFDFRGTKSSIELSEKEETITLVSDDEYKVRSLAEIVEGRLARRGVPLKNLDYGRIEDAAGGTARQVITLRSGIPQETAKKITKAIRDAKIKVNARVEGDQIRVVGPKKDDLQAVITLLQNEDFGLELQFVNYR